MKLQPRARTGIALLAAYAIALQALLLAFIAPSAALAGTAVLPICAGIAGHSVPPNHGQAGHGQDCLDACLTGCCCGAPLVPAPARASHYAPRPLRGLAAAFAAPAPTLIRGDKAHRSRAPPAA